MKTLILGALAAASLAAAALPAAAQPIDQRENNQQHRIEQGVRSGELTPRETYRAERREASIRHEERVMRHHHDGRLTRFDRKVLNHRLNRSSHAIYTAKHNDRAR